MLVATDRPSALAAREATSTIPIVFTIGLDPVQIGLVTSFNRPGGNATGVSMFTTELGPKRLGLVRELLPKQGTIAFVVNPNSGTTPSQIQEMQAAAQSVGRECGGRTRGRAAAAGLHRGPCRLALGAATRSRRGRTFPSPSVARRLGGPPPRHSRPVAVPRFARSVTCRLQNAQRQRKHDDTPRTGFEHRSCRGRQMSRDTGPNHRLNRI